MLIWRERDVEMDVNLLYRLLPNQNCKNLRNDTRAPYTDSINMVLRACGGAWGSDLPEVHCTSGCGPSRRGSNMYFYREKLEGRPSG